MTTHLPMPSTQSAKSAAGTKMRFLYPLAAVCLALVLLSPSAGVAQTGKQQKLRPDTQRLIEATLQEAAPAMRPLMRDQLANQFASFSEAQVALMLKGLADNGGKAAAKSASEPVEEARRALSPEDFEFNRKQFEPVIRRHWDAQKTFDDFVNARLTSYCPKRDDVARFGAAWRYELATFHEPSAVASWNPDIDVQVMGSAYAPQDGRYKFDFSKVRYSFDETATDAAIRQACDSYKKLGVEFLAKLDPMIAAQNWGQAFRLEQTSGGAVEPIRTKLDTKLAELSPLAGYPVMTALQNGKKVK